MAKVTILTILPFFKRITINHITRSVMTLNIIKIIAIGLIFSINVHAQFDTKDDVYIPSTPEEYEKFYQENIKKSRINGIYIPKDLEDAFAELDDKSPEEGLKKFTKAPEEVIAHKLHFGLGRWIYVYWNFREGSRYVEYLRNLGLVDPDQMIQFTIVSYHRYKNNKPLKIQEQIDALKKEMEAKLEKRRHREKKATKTITLEKRKLTLKEIEELKSQKVKD